MSNFHEETRRKLESVFANILQEPVEAISDDTSPLTAPRWDSICHIELVLAVEGAFNVQFTTSEIATFRKLADFRQTLQMRGLAA